MNSENSVFLSEREICDVLDFCGELQQKSLEIYKLAVAHHNLYQRLLFKLKTGVELKD